MSVCVCVCVRVRAGVVVIKCGAQMKAVFNLNMVH